MKAIELYIKYDECAADMIHDELSNPDRKCCQGGNRVHLSGQAAVLLGYRWACQDPRPLDTPP
ncbi:hypothetical protein [Syntrophaceticus schinkii]|nr:hypothetical protein [Syntrophaceticus schinkii]